MDSIGETKGSRALALKLSVFEQGMEETRGMKQAMMQGVLTGIARLP